MWFYHDPLQCQHFCLVKCKARIQNLGPGGPPESIDLIQSSCYFKQQKILRRVLTIVRAEVANIP